jgi:hypothetical protein
MKFKIHVPTKQYAFIEAEVEGTAVDAVNMHKSIDYLLGLEPEEFKAVPNGLSTKEYAQVRKHLLLTNEFDPNLEAEASYAQLRAIKDFNNTLRAIKDEQ